MSGHHRSLHLLTNSVPSRRSSDLNRNGKLSAHTLFNLLSVDPLALESLLAHFDRLSVPITAKCDTDALPSTAGAVHKLSVVTSEASPGGKQIKIGRAHV